MGRKHSVPNVQGVTSGTERAVSIVLSTFQFLNFQDISLAEDIRGAEESCVMLFN